jgi:hypothetical protein
MMLVNSNHRAPLATLPDEAYLEYKAREAEYKSWNRELPGKLMGGLGEMKIFFHQGVQHQDFAT